MHENAETREIRWNKREFALSERAEALGLELQRDNDGCYWLDYIDDQEMRSIGPMDLDEVKDRLDTTENGLSFEQANEYVAKQRWERWHPELEGE